MDPRDAEIARLTHENADLRQAAHYNADASKQLDDARRAAESECVQLTRVAKGYGLDAQTAKGRASELESERARLRAEVERWQQAFRNFAAHSDDCPKRLSIGGWCNCGYSALIRELDAAATPPAGEPRG